MSQVFESLNRNGLILEALYDRLGQNPTVKSKKKRVKRARDDDMSEEEENAVFEDDDHRETAQ